MGQAKQKQKALAANYDSINEAAAKVSHAIIRLFNATSLQQGADCFTVATVAQGLLADLGIATELVAGHASWRVGPGDSDVIGHQESGQQLIMGGLQGFAYHAWLVFPGKGLLVDFTTYQLPLKGAQMDAMDGGTTVVNWAPSYLLVAASTCQSERAVLMAAEPVAYHYDPKPAILARLMETYQESPDNLSMARMVMANPDVNVMGPASIGV
ncbi:hypothetical protein [Comamonas thiooxydans]|uniref:hypothetical protein n=1 Tax=Comamonas thiooxydans TaxID=363952 RepID=UPI000B418DF9|nr:hypothetical protein [Comamonas thiooxydans]